MFIAALFLCAFVSIAVLSFPIIINHVIRRIIDQKQADIEAKIAELSATWLEPAGEGKSSRLAEVFDLAGKTVGSAAARSIMQNLKSDEGHVAMVANGLADEIQGKQNPLLGLLAGRKRGKGAAVMKLAEMLGPMIQNMGQGGGSGNGHETGVSVKGRLNR